MSQLIKCINQKVTNNLEEVESCIVNMLCDDTQPIPLAEETITKALSIEGEFLGLKMHYDDFESELENQILKYKISQALSIVVSFEDDGSNFGDIKRFVEYMREISGEKQNFVFGVKDVTVLSGTPITILFSGILPINQLKMSIGENIHSLIHSDDTYFIPRFDKLRDDISQEINIPILPIFPSLDSTLGENQALLIDSLNNKTIADFNIDEKPDKESLEVYLSKLFYIYKHLGANQSVNHNTL